MTRRAHQCHKDGCDSEAQWALSLSFFTVSHGIFKHQIDCASTIKVCGRHQKDAMEYVMSPRNRANIATWMTRQNLPLPDFASVEVLFTRVDHEEIDAGIADEIASAALEEGLRQ